MAKVLSIATALVGLALIETPWVLHFAADRTAVSDVVVAGIVVAVIGIFATVELLAADLTR